MTQNYRGHPRDAAETVRVGSALGCSICPLVRWLDHAAGRCAEELTSLTRPAAISVLSTSPFATVGAGSSGELGTSIATKQAVWDRIMERVPATLELTATGLLLGLFMGVPLGVLSAVRRVLGSTMWCAFFPVSAMLCQSSGWA